MFESKVSSKAVLVASLTICSLISFSAFSDVLTGIAKKAYKGSETYEKISKTPDSFRKKKVKIDVIMGDWSDIVPESLKDVFTKYYGTISINSEKGSLLPIVYSNKNDKLKSNVEKLDAGTPVTLYGTVQYKIAKIKKGRKTTSSKVYYFEIDDIDERSLDNAPESEDEFKADAYAKVKPRRLDIQYEDHIGKKVEFTVTFRDISDNLPKNIINAGYLPEEYFVLIPVEQFHTRIVVKRDNELCITPIIDATTNKTKLKLYCLLKSATETPSARSRFIVVHRVEKSY